MPPLVKTRSMTTPATRAKVNPASLASGLGATPAQPKRKTPSSTSSQPTVRLRLAPPASAQPAASPGQLIALADWLALEQEAAALEGQSPRAVAAVDHKENEPPPATGRSPTSSAAAEAMVEGAAVELCAHCEEPTLLGDLGGCGDHEGVCPSCREELDHDTELSERLSEADDAFVLGLAAALSGTVRGAQFG